MPNEHAEQVQNEELHKGIPVESTTGTKLDNPGMYE
jgi:hypothetical protein